MQVNFIYSTSYNGKASWTGMVDTTFCILRWNAALYWEIVNWPPAYGIDPRNYTDTPIPTSNQWVLEGSPELMFTLFLVSDGVCPIIPPVDNCGLVGNVLVTTCDLSGTAIITVEPIPPPCQRPVGLSIFTLLTGYNTIPVTTPVVSTGSQLAACNAITYINSNPATVTYINGYSTSPLSLGQKVYANDGTMNCSYVPDGWYFTEESAYYNYVYHIVSGTITEFNTCVTTTTTTTLVPPTTTTTTTVAPTPCINYQAGTYSVATIIYVDCAGVTQYETIGGTSGFDTITFCATSIIDNGGASISVLGLC